MPLVFVHGVNVRKDGSAHYERAERQRDAYFKELVLAPIAADSGRLMVRNPYWGDLGAHFPWGHGGLPEVEYETFGREAGLEPEEVLPAAALARLPLPENVLVLPWLARHNLEAAVDLLFATTADPAAVGPDSVRLARLAGSAGAYALAHRQQLLAWLDEVTSDEDFVDRLISEAENWRQTAAAEAPAWESFGLQDAWDAVRESAGRIRRAGRQLARTQFRERVRDPLHQNVARFLGDAFAYLKSRGERGAAAPILALITSELETADQVRRGTDEPLIVVAHSMGGIVVYDLLSHFRPDIGVDVLVTVGSQVAVFEELKLFQASDPEIPDASRPKVNKPAGVGAWCNVLDHADVLGFAAGRVFEDVQDLEYDTGALLLGAHESYFAKPSFHCRLARRVGRPGWDA